MTELNIFVDPWVFTEKDGIFYILLGEEIIAESPYPEIANLIALIPDTIRVAYALKSALGMDITEEERTGLITETEEYFEDALHIRATPVQDNS